jgi:hypothetical protein
MFEEIEVKQNDYLNSVKNEIMELDNKSLAMKISNDNEYGFASEILKMVKLKIKNIEERRKEITAPLNDYIRIRNAEFKPFTNHLEELKTNIEAEMFRYNKILQEKLRIEAEQKRQEELKRLKEEESLQRMKASLTENKIDDFKADVIAIKQKEIENKEVEIKNSFKTESVNTIVSECWDFEIINDDDIPANLKSGDPKKIKLAIKSGLRECQGLRIFDKGRITSR